MSRIGKLPVDIPEKVEVKLSGNTIEVKGPKGLLKKEFGAGISLEKKEKSIAVKPVDDSLHARSMWGMARNVIQNMVTGVTIGFSKNLEYSGVGYKAVAKGKMLNLSLGYSHPIDYPLPEGVEAKVERNVIKLSSIDKELLGFVAAKIRSFRPPEPYKGKGIKYQTETIIRKAGKTGAKK